ncbi:MAG: helix-turn-helix domain-containing protein [Desulfosporosinus sp.]|jgi:plasmid maintenance system antidote protein VapI
MSTQEKKMCVKEKQMNVKTKKKVVYKGKKVRDARLQASIGSQKELAEMTGIAPNIISDLERGKRMMSRTWAIRIGEAVGVYWGKLME